MQWLLKIVFLFLTVLASAQFPVFVGMPKDDVIKEIETNYKQFSQNTDFKNSKLKYLKFVDRIGDETLLIFISDDDICTLTKLMTGYDNEDARLAQLKTFKKTGSDQWETNPKGNPLQITIKREEWYLTFIVKPKT